jgi:two-component system, chemotaxis family, response regulator Rcp1
VNGTTIQTDPLPPNLIVLDLNLPRVSGHEILRALKADELRKQIPIVILSSSRAERDVEQAYELHAACYLHKPATLDAYERMCVMLNEVWLRIATLPRVAEPSLFSPL